MGVDLVLSPISISAALGQGVIAYSASILLAAARRMPTDPAMLRISHASYRLALGWIAVNIVVGLGAGGFAAAMHHNLALFGIGAYNVGIVTIIHGLVVRRHGLQIARARWLAQTGS